MENKADSTKKLIVTCARQEFLDAGFHNASMRKIASAANVTTGAIYRYFPDKRLLFFAATEEAVSSLRDMINRLTDDALIGAAEGVSYGEETSKTNIVMLYNLIYENFDQFYLLLMSSDSTDSVDFLHEFVEMEERSTLAYIDALKTRHGSKYEIDKIALHFLLEAYVSALLEPVRHQMSKEDAIFHSQNLSLYFSVGWLGLEEIMKKEK